MNLVLIPGSSEVMTKVINTQNAVYVYLCVFGSLWHLSGVLLKVL